ncbi:C4-dicarboxylate TRAP transporter substrate-binding protein [Oceanicella sp. SM1341]|uniref:C4-dicarboxylate TRAP transporter substrate-binding protein n=1 Tax=Oceanicella sp. SM1341 TaxID=1548889 RepID=UPI000E50C3C2|nr:C4-dicarboxylate TRAP transporter substrate-binding protein [Oceanicella sp. SM1341]
MKKAILKGTCLLGALACALPAFADSYNYATFVPPQAANNTIALQPAFDRIAEETDGEVEINLLAGGQLLGGADMLAGVRDGIADLGFVIPVYAPSELPNSVVISDMMPYGADPVAVAGAALETQLLDCPQCQKDFTDNNLVFLGGHVPTPYRLLCRNDVTSMADLRGLRMRGGSGAMARTAEALGGTPVNMSAGDMYEALERGQLDCVVGPIAWLRQYSLGEVIGSVLGEPLGVLGGLGLVTWNVDSWEGLSEEDRQVVLKEMPGIVARATILGYMADDNEVRAQYEDKVKFNDSVPEIREALDTINAEALPGIVEAAAARNATDPEAIAKAYLENLKRWQVISQEQVKGDPEALARVLWEEIYSKVDL